MHELHSAPPADARVMFSVQPLQVRRRAREHHRPRRFGGILIVQVRIRFSEDVRSEQRRNIKSSHLLKPNNVRKQRLEEGGEGVRALVWAVLLGAVQILR